MSGTKWPGFPRTCCPVRPEGDPLLNLPEPTFRGEKTHQAKAPAPPAIMDQKNIRPEGLTHIIYKCIKKNIYIRTQEFFFKDNQSQLMGKDIFFSRANIKKAPVKICNTLKPHHIEAIGNSLKANYVPFIKCP